MRSDGDVSLLPLNFAIKVGDLFRKLKEDKNKSWKNLETDTRRCVRPVYLNIRIV